MRQRKVWEHDVWDLMLGMMIGGAFLFVCDPFIAAGSCMISLAVPFALEGLGL